MIRWGVSTPAWPRHAAQMAVLAATRLISQQPCQAAETKVSAGFKSNHAPMVVSKRWHCVIWIDQQPLQPWFYLFQNTVDIARLSEDDAVMHELRL